MPNATVQVLDVILPVFTSEVHLTKFQHCELRTCRYAHVVDLLGAMDYL